LQILSKSEGQFVHDANPYLYDNRTCSLIRFGGVRLKNIRSKIRLPTVPSGTFCNHPHCGAPFTSDDLLTKEETELLRLEYKALQSVREWSNTGKQSPVIFIEDPTEVTVPPSVIREKYRHCRPCRQLRQTSHQADLRNRPSVCPTCDTPTANGVCTFYSDLLATYYKPAALEPRIPHIQIFLYVRHPDNRVELEVYLVPLLSLDIWDVRQSIHCSLRSSSELDTCPIAQTRCALRMESKRVYMHPHPEQLVLPEDGCTHWVHTRFRDLYGSFRVRMVFELNNQKAIVDSIALQI
jgi:hypothetical protein